MDGYQSNLQVVVRIVQQWLSSERKAKNLAAVQSTRLDVSAVSVWCWSPTEVLESCQFLIHIGILKKYRLPAVRKWLKIDELAGESENKEAESLLIS